jgi:hypothetical protein
MILGAGENESDINLLADEMNEDELFGGVLEQ